MRMKAVQRDANEPVIVAAFESLGWMVQRLSGDGVPDLLCWTGERFILVEVKDGSRIPSERKLTMAQEAWHRQWCAAGAPVFVVVSVEEVETLGRAEARRMEAP